MENARHNAIAVIATPEYRAAQIQKPPYQIEPLGRIMRNFCLGESLAQSFDGCGQINLGLDDNGSIIRAVTAYLAALPVPLHEPSTKAVESYHLFCHLFQTQNKKVALGATFKVVVVGAHGFEPRTLCL